MTMGGADESGSDSLVGQQDVVIVVVDAELLDLGGH